VVIAVVSVRVVEVAVDQVVDVVAVRNGRMAAVGPMHMAFLVPAAVMGGSAAIGVGGIDLENVLIDVTGVRMVQVAIVQIIHMSVMLDSHVAAARAVLVVVVCVNLAVAHGVSVALRIGSVQGPYARQRDCRSP
jgi:hypothetical protein